MQSSAPVAMMIADNDTNPPNLGTRYRAGLKSIIANGKHNEILERYDGTGNVPKNCCQRLDRFQRRYQISFAELNK